MAFPEHNMKQIAENPFFKINKIEGNEFNEYKKFYTYISTDF